MDHNRSLLCIVLGCVLQLEALRQVVVNLDCTKLPTTADGILNHEVELRTVEGSLANLLVYLKTLLTASLADSVLRLSPNLLATDVLLGILRIVERNLSLVIVEAEDAEHLEDDVNDVLKLLFYLIRTNKEVSVVLCKGTYTCQSVQLATLLIAEHCTKLGDTQRQILVRAWLTCEYLAVVRTVHRLEHILLVLLWCVDRLESILAIMSVVA